MIDWSISSCDDYGFRVFPKIGNKPFIILPLKNQNRLDPIPRDKIQ